MLVWVFIILSILYAPVCYMYYKGSAFIESDNMFHQMTLGNLGHANSICNHQFASNTISRNIQCNKGLISELTLTGLMPRHNISKHAYRYDQCTNPNNFTEVSLCTRFFLDSE